MKKIVLLVVCVLCLTGCSKKVTCIKENKNKDYKVEAKSIYTYKKDQLVEINNTSTITFKTEKEAKDYYNQYKETAKFNKQYGTDEEIKKINNTKASYKKKKFILEESYSENEIKGDLKLTKEKFLKTYEENGYKCKK